MSLVRSDAPSEQPVTLEEAKAHCRVDFTDDDTLIPMLIEAAVDYLDGLRGVLGRCLINQTYDLGLPFWQSRIELPFPDCSSVTITYRDATGAEQTVDPADHSLDHSGGLPAVVFGDGFAWPAVQSGVVYPITISFVCGYGDDAADVPAALRLLILQLVAHWYDHRQAAVMTASINDLPMAAQEIIASHRVTRFGA